MSCAEAREHLAAYLDPSGEARAAALEGHLAACPGCRADLARYQELGRRLASLAKDPIDPPPWLLPTLLEGVQEACTRANRWSLSRWPNSLESARALRRRVARLADPRVALAGGVVVAGVAGALAIRTRRRRHRHTLRRRLRAAVARA